MKQFTLLIKPASADCNLRCEYCFYLDRSHLYPEQKIHRMPDDVLESMISSYMATVQSQYVFSWQGGEPSLMGLDFFRRAVELQQKHGRNGSVVANSLQTNATLITDEFAEFMAEYSFLVGVSIDGPAELHDQYRRNTAGAGSHARVIEGVDTLNRNKVEFNALTLVSSSNVNHGREVYRYLRDMEILYHQYIPCVEFDADGSPLPWTISAEEWGRFLCDVFDEWMIRDTRKVSVRLFDAIVIMMVDGYRSLCHLNNNCCQYLVVEHNGDIYPCDFFVNADLKLGNVQTDSWGSVQDSALYRSFGAQKTQWNAKCGGCEFRDICLGDCLKHRIGAGGRIERLSWLCEGWKTFFRHSLPGFQRLAREVISDRRMIMGPANAPTESAYTGIGRNDPCPCGSGKKYKKCHGS